ncbi:MAG: GyrI-like domain-containing protein [Cytophagaceae bacterium]
MNKKFALYLFLIAFLVAGVILYAWLGGFKDPAITVVDAGPYYVAGKKFHSRLNDKALGNFFNEAEELGSKAYPDGTVAGIFYNEPVKPTDTISAFIGIAFSAKPDSLPENYSLDSLPARRVVEARIESHYLVVPVNIYAKIQEYAKQQNMKLQMTPALELYPGENKLVVQVPVAD